MQKKKYDQEKYNPCLKEANISYKCLSDNGYDKDKCELQIENYNLCKKFWGFIKTDRRKNGIKPYLPDPQDREAIKSQYIDAFLRQNTKM
ncbi:coiled-coil-helix-coiled-coil-helix domain-containing protein 7 [Agrilus planipennis]|uniref:Coiled-coil-helix-coiled-coil-helix domain-containing protein 7 n=1 Tax=Agrilus planipennis TaxID=224129 RepID=A0A1W4WZQ7_AGRPL|nr:coiled-coil-helix-coiled-coil-helix domain-containing protein 7 [Agrilus planipennis]